MAKFGAHLSIAGGYKNALQKIIDIGRNCLQIFSTSPRGWNKADLTEEGVIEFLQLKEKLKVDPIYFHASYLINLADSSRIGHLSKDSLIHELNIASRFDVKGSIIHTGSYKHNCDDKICSHITADQHKVLIKNIKEILDKTPENTLLIIENAGNRKIGRTIDEIAQIIKDINNVRVRVCLDTCHLYSAGYNLTTKNNLDNFLKDFDKKIGLNKLELWHINDSRDPLGSLRDRHENIGEGSLGIETFKNIMNHPKLKNLPLIIETPGFDQEGPDKKNLDILKNLII